MQARNDPSTPRSLRVWLTLSLVLLFCGPVSFAERVDDLPKPTDYVSDYAHVLSPAAVAKLDRLCSQLDHSKTNAQIAIVTVNNLGGDDIDDFSNRLATKWSMGSKGSGRGLLMLFAIQDRKRRIEVGGGLQGILTDAKVGDIGRMMVPDLRQRNYDGAVTLGLTQIADAIAEDAKVSLEDDRANAGPQDRALGREPRHHGSPVGLIFRIVIIALVLLFLGARGLFGFGLGMLFGGGGRGGWGGDGGGSSGGSSGGGGFGGFGGGGDFDGGGAGGDW